MPLVDGVAILPEDVYLIVHDSLLELMSNTLSDSNGDLPMVYSAFLERFLGILTGLPQVCLDSDMSCPLIDRRFINGSLILLELIWFTERAFSHRIFGV